MKTVLKKVLGLFIFFTVLFIQSKNLVADPPPGPNPGGNGSPAGTGGTPVGAPIDGGLGILIVMGAGYGVLKWQRKGKRSLMR